MDVFNPAQSANRQGSVARRFSLAGALAVIALAPGPSGVGAAEPQVDSYEKQTLEVQQGVASIGERIGEVGTLRERAVKEGSSIKISCIDEKLHRIEAAREAARKVLGGWRFARSNTGYAQRSLDRLRLLRVHALANADEAFACTDGRSASQTLVQTVSPIPEVGTGTNPVPPPVIERPPFASSY